MRRVTIAILFMCAAAAIHAQEIRPGVYRTPDERFENLPDYDFEPHYAEIDGYRMHYIDAGPSDGDPVLLLHGEPTWAFLYRHMVPALADAGHRVIVPDLIGFGRSDKPADMETHTYKFHVDNIAALVEELELHNITFFGQDWGGLIGLRVVAENPERFARVIVSNTGLPTGDQPMGEAFTNWKRMNQQMIDRGDMDTGIVASTFGGGKEIADAYRAPFPAPEYKAGPLILPQRVPVTRDDPAREANLAAWEVLRTWDKPFLTAFGDSDPITRGADKLFQAQVPGAKGQPHTTLEGAGHFIQETHGKQLAEIINNFIATH